MDRGEQWHYPLHCTDNINQLVSGSLMNMESLHLVYSPPISPLKINQQNKVQNGPPMDVVYSVKSFSNKRFAGSTVRHLPRNKTLANKAAKWNVSRKSLPGNNSSAVIPNGSGLIRPSAVKKSSRKKSRKKGKHNKKASCNVGSTEPEVISEDYGNGSSSSETCGNNDMDGWTMSSTALEISLPDNKNSEAPKKTCTSVGDGMEVLTKDSRSRKLEGMEVIYHNKASSYSNVYPTSFPDVHDSYVLDSISVGSIRDGSTNVGHDEKNTEKEIYNLDLSYRKGYFSRRNSLNDVVNAFDHTKGTRLDTYSFRNSDQKFVVLNKRSKQNKVQQRSANVVKSGSAGNMRAGKENSRSIWQKVQKKDVDDCTTELKKAATIHSKSDINLSENRKELKDKVSKKLKRKPAATVKQEYYCYSRKGSYASMAGSDGSFKARMSLSDISDMSQAKDEKVLSLGLKSCSQPTYPKVGFLSSKVECTNSESVRRMQLCPNEMDHIESPYPPHLLCGAASQVVPKQISLAESSRQNHSSYGSLTHKWMPVGLKDCELASSSRRDTSSSEHIDEASSKRWTVKSAVEGDTVSKAAIQSRSQSRGDVCYSEDIEGMPPKSDPVKELTSNALDEANCLSSSDVSKRLDESEAHPSKIVEAINYACRAQLASEAVQMSTGHPIAEFERLLYHSSPIVHQSLSCTSCHTCCSSDVVNQVGGVSLCKHETPNITLGCLWEWYERYGSYGLEIMAEEVGNSPRLGADRFSFRAYFVPFLSGIQLFRNCGSTNYVDIGRRFYSDQLLSSYWNNDISRESSSLGSFPICSVLSQPDSMEDAITPPPLVSEKLTTSKLPSDSASNVPDQSSYTTGFSDLDLLLEYFELEQPQMRRPLHDKIKELVSGDEHSRSKVYGDPTILHSICLNDIHPRSWYSVAWYPIYRIPDGNFRAAFLTYHSLGHLVHRSVNFESPSLGDCIVTPVVGLQSYNAQGECWFQLRPSELAESTLPPSLNSYEVMEERLRILEETASLMARAVVKKGNMTCINKHPDYEFFLSSRRGLDGDRFC